MQACGFHESIVDYFISKISEKLKDQYKYDSKFWWVKLYCICFLYIMSHKFRTLKFVFLSLSHWPSHCLSHDQIVDQSCVSVLYVWCLSVCFVCLCVSMAVACSLDIACDCTEYQTTVKKQVTWSGKLADLGIHLNDWKYGEKKKKLGVFQISALKKLGMVGRH